MKEKIKLQVRHLTKKFGDLLVLNDVSFDVKEGEFFVHRRPYRLR